MDTSAGPYKNYTVVFLGSDNGHVLKTLASTEGANASFSTQLLEDIDVYNPNKSDHRLFFVYMLIFLFCLSLNVFSLFIFFLFFVLTWSLSSSRPLCVLPRSALPTHSLVYCNALHHPVQLEGMLFFSCLRQLVKSICTEFDSQPAFCIIFRLWQSSAALI